MSVIILLIFFSMLVAGGFLAAFFWAVKSGQFDDQYTPSIRVLFENGKSKQNANGSKAAITQPPSPELELHNKKITA